MALQPLLNQRMAHTWRAGATPFFPLWVFVQIVKKYFLLLFSLVRICTSDLAAEWNFRWRVVKKICSTAEIILVWMCWVTPNPWLCLVRVATCFNTLTSMLFREKECAMNICSWITVEIWNCPRRTHRWSLSLWLMFYHLGSGLRWSGSQKHFLFLLN